MKDVNPDTSEAAIVVGSAPAQEYSIEADWRMMEIMISGLYSDKVRAVVRELCTNALDAQIDAGNAERPFRVTLPTRWDTNFSIRDYGVSLTDEQVMVLYTRLGKSTKNGDNNTVGKFGLGCKSPFAYTDSFMVTAYMNGEKRSYNALKGGAGQKPQMVPMGTEPTDEENGLEVTFAVKERDIDAFHTAMKRVALGFAVLPECNIQDLKNVDQIKAVTFGQSWKMVERDHIRGLTGFHVRQGCVLYPVDPAPLRSARPNDSDAIDALSGEVLILDMPIGSVEITPSRETLSYDPVTIKNLLEAITDIYKDYVRKFSEALENAGTLFEAMALRNQLLKQVNNNSLRDKIEKNLRWRGKAVLSSIHLNGEKLGLLRKHGCDINYLNRERKGRSAGRYVNTLRQSLRFSINDINTPTFLYWSTPLAPTGMSHRINTFIATQGPANLYVLPNFTPNSYAHKMLFVALGRPEAGLVLVDLATVTYTRQDYTKFLAEVTIWDRRTNTFRTSYTFANEVNDETENVFFVSTHRNEFKQFVTPYDTGDTTTDKKGNKIPKILDYVLHGKTAMESVWSHSNILIPDDATIVAIPASRKDFARNIPDSWTDLFAFLLADARENYDEDLHVKVVAEEYLAYNTNFKNYSKLFDLLWDDNECNIADPNSPLAEAMLLSEDLKQSVLTIEKRRLTARKFVINTFGTPDDKLRVTETPANMEMLCKVFDAIHANLVTTYPLLDTLIVAEHRYGYCVDIIQKNNVKKIIDYVNMVDRLAAANLLEEHNSFETLYDHSVDFQIAA